MTFEHFQNADDGATGGWQVGGPYLCEGGPATARVRGRNIPLEGSGETRRGRKIPKQTSKKGISEGSLGPQINDSHGKLCLLGPKEVQMEGDVLIGNTENPSYPTLLSLVYSAIYPLNHLLKNISIYDIYK